MNYNYYNFNRPNNIRPNNTPIMNNNQNGDRLAGGFLGPFVLGGITGGLVAPFFYGNNNRPVYYYPPYYYPYRPY